MTASDTLLLAAARLAARGQLQAATAYVRAAEDHVCHPEVCTGQCGYVVEAQRILAGAR